MSTPTEIRAHADECERYASAAISPTNQQLLLNIAARWRALADEDEAAAEAMTALSHPLLTGSGSCPVLSASALNRERALTA
jgi:hypothetical protein